MNASQGKSTVSRRSDTLLRVMIGVLVLVFVQLGLFLASLERWLDGRPKEALPAFGASVVCFIINLLLLSRVRNIDSQENRDHAEP